MHYFDHFSLLKVTSREGDSLLCKWGSLICLSVISSVGNSLIKTCIILLGNLLNMDPLKSFVTLAILIVISLSHKEYNLLKQHNMQYNGHNYGYKIFKMK